jgi:hypothetical protein
MGRYVLKLYRRTPPAKASKVTKRIGLEASDKAEAIMKARALYRDDRADAEFAMLFVAGGDLVWVSESAPGREGLRDEKRSEDGTS